MVSVNNNPVTTEYDLKAQSTVGSANTSPVNSIMTKGVQSNTPEAGENETLESKLNRIVSQYSNITAEDVKKLLNSVCGYSEAQLEKLDKNELDKILSSLEEALKQCSKNQKVDTERLQHRFRAYNTMVIKGDNTIEEANEHINKFKNMTLVDVLKHKGLIDKNTSLKDLSEEELKASIAKFINDKAEGKNLTPEQIAQQRKRLARLISNSSDEEKTMLWKAITNIVAKENTCPALDTMISSFVKPEKLQAFLQSHKVEDLVNMGLSEQDIQKYSYLLSANLNEEGLKKHREDIVNFIAELGKANKDIIDSIKEKEALALEQGIEPEFTDEELAVINRLNKLKNVEAGNISGTANNKVITDDFKTEFLAQLINDAKENGTFEDVMGLVKEFAQNNQELTPEKFDELMNELTEDLYQDIKTPTEKRQEKTETPSVGFAPRESVEQNQNKLKDLRQQINTTEEQPKFTISKDEPVETTSLAVSSNFKDIIKNSSNKKLAIKGLYSINTAFRLAVESMVLRSSTPTIVLNYLPNSIKVELAAKLYEQGKIDEDDVKHKLDLSFAQRNQVLNA